MVVCGFSTAEQFQKPWLIIISDTLGNGMQQEIF
jgi:hypothetical protein